MAAAKLRRGHPAGPGQLDLIQAEREGTFSFARVAGDLAALCKGEAKGRREAGEITLFKSCGTALEDLAAAVMVYTRSG